MMTRPDYMTYLPDMEEIDSDMMGQVIGLREAYQPPRYTIDDVRRALGKEKLSSEDFGALLSPAADAVLEQMARRAMRETRTHFGNAVHFFTPLYLANYCENHCVYCGFNCHNRIHRAKLNEQEMRREMEAIRQSGLEEILLLTGESRAQSDVDYIVRACEIAREYFRIVGVEVYPMNTDEYATIHRAGADYVTVFQETYDSERYGQLHLAGHKRIFPYRFYAQERALRGGMRGVGFGALLGLGDPRRDALATGIHAYLVQQKYPQAEIAFSCPRIRPIQGGQSLALAKVDERLLFQIICAYRIWLPFASITVSTRERAEFRDRVMGLAGTKISAGVAVGVGGHDEASKGDEQFEIADTRSVEEVHTAMIARGLQPVMGEHIYV